jgi:hypothetical protein
LKVTPFAVSASITAAMSATSQPSTVCICGVWSFRVETRSLVPFMS